MSATATMSSKRIEANRRNAQRSCGPRTPEGKSRVRLNALKHGLTASTVVLPGEDAAALQARVEAWKDDLGPRSALEDYLVERAAHVSWQLDRADRTIAARLTDRMRHHATDGESREADEVADLARRLFWDPRGPIALYPHFETLGVPRRISWPVTVEDPLNPARIVNRLESTALGCRCLLDRWAELRKVLDDGLKWGPPDRLRAIRLLGRQPLDAVENDRVMSIYLACGAMDPDNPHEFDDLCSELEAGGERIRYLERVHDRDAWARKPESPEAGRAVLLEIVAHAVTHLEHLLSIHQARQAPERPGRLDGLAFDDSDEGECLRRYQLAHGRTLLRTINTIFKVRKATDADRGGGTAEPGADAPPATGEPSMSQDDETNPIPPGSSSESGLQAASDPEDRLKPGLQPAPPTPDPLESGLQAASPSDHPDRLKPGLQRDTVPDLLESRLQADSGPVHDGETKPSQAERRSRTPLDPCTEGLRLEPPIDSEPPIPISAKPSKSGGSKSGRPKPSRPLPPMMIRLLTELVLRQAETGGPSPPLRGQGRFSP